MLSEKMKQIIKSFYYAILKPRLLSSFKRYTFSDEHLKFSHILEGINYLRVADMPKTYLEFGVHSGRTFSTAINAANYLKIQDMSFYAFDSFQGLPEIKESIDGTFKTGEFKTKITDWKKIIKRKTGRNITPENIVQGYYEDSLKNDPLPNLKKAGFVYIDVDLYSSCKEVLNYLRPKLCVGTLIMFDDWYCFNAGESMGERLALEEFCKENPNFEFETWKNFSTFGKSFFVTKI